MQVSSRARLAWANRNIEAAADIIVADYIRGMVAKANADPYRDMYALGTLSNIAKGLDPEGEN